jgi:hypothetical protein
MATTCGLKVYSTNKAKQIPLESAFKEYSEKAIGAGEYCAHTLLDFVDASKTMLHDLNQRERLFRLCTELAVEMDGVRVPATAAAILNAIRAIVADRG